MNVTSVGYSKLVNLGNYENHKVEIFVELEEGDTPSEALRRAKAFVEKALEPAPDEFDLKKARAAVADPEGHSPRQVRAAQELLDRVEQCEIPF